MMEEEINWNKAFNGSNINNLSLGQQREPKIDVVVSKIVGKNIFQTDKRLIELVAKWKKESNPNEPNNFLEQEKYINELKEVFK